jgi:hypothetical protein
LKGIHKLYYKGMLGSGHLGEEKGEEKRGGGRRKEGEGGRRKGGGRRKKGSHTSD